ncbi:FkbM family methyltransferase [Nocardioides seonyuensis]|uniref:FkbM family methyltransferase n=1 Tax=Nocardioides seonyuensis TaxID=2518371 RepID=A0A4P7IEF7_9ACTN|nr:FkbM family methyltransferase [Nocardioides seonyuensis]QBX55619.1 FkbM family methyltransferase [Nocardioides seonyuensis]
MKWTRPPAPAAARRPVAPRPYTGERLVCLESDAGPLWIPESDDVMRPYIAAQGVWEAEEGRLLLELARPSVRKDATGRPVVRVADIGANVGYFSLLLAKTFPGAIIDAFEPHPTTSAVLALNAWNSGADITPHAVALSAGARLLGLTTAATNLGDTRTAETDVADMLTPAAPLDDLLPDAVYDLVKIDVQGYEPDVLAGMTDALHRSPQPVIVSEFWPAALRDRGLDPMDVLEGYRAMGLEIRAHVADAVTTMDDAAIVRVCDEAGPFGQVNLVMSKADRSALR